MIPFHAPTCQECEHLGFRAQSVAMMKDIHPVQNHSNREKRPKCPTTQYGSTKDLRPPPTPHHARDRHQQRQKANKTGYKRLNLKRIAQLKPCQMHNRPRQSACGARYAEETLHRTKHDSHGVRKGHTTNRNAPATNDTRRIPDLSATDCGARFNCRKRLRHEAAEASPAASMTGTASS